MHNVENVMRGDEMARRAGLTRAIGPRLAIGLSLAIALAAASLSPGGAVASAATAIPSAPTAIPPLRTGVSYVYDDDPAAFEHVEQAGAQLALTPLRWAQIAPKRPPAAWDPSSPSDPHYNWKPFDLWVINAVQFGRTPILQLRGAPLWAQRCPEPTETDAPCRPDPAALADFATAAARRYSGSFEGLPRVRYWQGLDEPNLSLFFDPQYEGDTPVSPTLYRELINTVYFAVKAVDPSNIVLAAGLAPLANPPWAIGPMRFARLLLCMSGGRHPHPLPGDCGGGVHFDVFDIHPYTTGGPTHEGGANDVELGDLPKLRALLDAADRAGRIKGRFERTPLWATEFGWDSNPPDPGGLPMAIETRWTAEALYRAWNAGVNHFFWYSLRDFPPEPNLPFSQTLQTGLYFRGATVEQDQPKELMYAFRFPFVAYPHKRGLFFWGRTPSSTPGKVAIQLQRGTRWRNALVVHADAHGMFTGLAPTAYGRHKHGSARAVYRGEASIPFSMRPVPDFRHPPFG